MKGRELIDFVKEEYRPHSNRNGLEADGKEYISCLEFLESNLDVIMDSGFIEIGSAWGASFHLWGTKIPQGLKISVDVHGLDHTEGISSRTYFRELDSNWFDVRLRKWNVYFEDVYQVVRNSMEQNTINIVANILDDKKVGWLYIDADHSYVGMKSDFENYKQFVKPGGFIGFHDISTQQCPGAIQCWKELRTKYANVVECENIIGIIKV